MKIFFKGLMAAFLLLFTVSCFDGESDSDDPSGGDIGSFFEVEETLRFSAGEEKTSVIQGQKNDTISIHFPKNAIKINEDTYQGVNLHVKVTYKNEKLFKISFEEDLEFNTPVSITFDSDSLSDNSIFLAYNGDGGSYLPFEKKDNKYTYSFEHFSEYEFKEAGSSEQQKNIMDSLLTQMESDSDKSEGVVPHIETLNEILAIAGILEVRGDVDSQAYIERAADVISAYAKAYINSVTDPEYYLTGYCMSLELEAKIQELLKNWSMLEKTDIQASENDIAETRLRDWFSNTADDFIAKSLDSGCDNLAVYVICGTKIASLAELSGFDEKSENVLNKIKSEFSNNLNNIINEQVKTDLTNCSELMDCLATALQFAHSLNMASDVSRIGVKLQNVEQDCRSGKCPYAWDITAQIDASYNSSSSFNHCVEFEDLVFVTTNEEWDAADVNNKCFGLEYVDVEKTAYADSDNSTLNFFGSFYLNYSWDGTLIPSIYLEKEIDGELRGEEAAFEESIIPLIRSGKSFRIETSRSSEGGGTINSSLIFTPHVPK